jgi:hypothetical protein
MGVALDTFTRVVEDGSGFGVVDEIADYAHPGKPCAVLGAAASGCLVQGQGHLRYKYYTSTHEMLLSHLPSLTHTTKTPSLITLFRKSLSLGLFAFFVGSLPPFL